MAPGHRLQAFAQALADRATALEHAAVGEPIENRVRRRASDGIAVERAAESAGWVEASVDSSIREAIIAMGPLAALRQGDDSARLLVREAMMNVAQRELVLLWWFANTDETRSLG